MAKTAFIDGDKSQGIVGTRILAAFMNKIFSHTHDGVDDDGHCSQIARTHLDTPTQGALVPTGTVIHVAQSSAPTGFLKANGAEISRVTYADLFAAIGTTFGVGNGSTTFNLPDLRGEFVRALDDGRAVDSGRTLGSAQGGTLVMIDMAPTIANVCVGSSSSSSATAIPDVNADATSQSRFGATARGTQAGPVSAAPLTQSTVEYTFGESRPRNVALLACIKY